MILESEVSDGKSDDLVQEFKDIDKAVDLTL
jgi:hypothetical protein